MHPYVAEELGRERIRQLYREAEQARLVREAVASEPRRPARAALGDRLVRLGLRLAGPEHGRLVAARYYGE